MCGVGVGACPPYRMESKVRSVCFEIAAYRDANGAATKACARRNARDTKAAGNADWRQGGETNPPQTRSGGNMQESLRGRSFRGSGGSSRARKGPGHARVRPGLGGVKKRRAGARRQEPPLRARRYRTRHRQQRRPICRMPPGLRPTRVMHGSRCEKTTQDCVLIRGPPVHASYRQHGKPFTCGFVARKSMVRWLFRLERKYACFFRTEADGRPTGTAAGVPATPSGRPRGSRRACGRSP